MNATRDDLLSQLKQVEALSEVRLAQRDELLAALEMIVIQGELSAADTDVHQLYVEVTKTMVKKARSVISKVRAAA